MTFRTQNEKPCLHHDAGANGGGPATDTKDYEADDLSGAGAKNAGESTDEMLFRHR